MATIELGQALHLQQGLKSAVADLDKAAPVPRHLDIQLFALKGVKPTTEAIKSSVPRFTSDITAISGLVTDLLPEAKVTTTGPTLLRRQMTVKIKGLNYMASAVGRGDVENLPLIMALALVEALIAKAQAEHVAKAKLEGVELGDTGTKTTRELGKSGAGAPRPHLQGFASPTAARGVHMAPAGRR